MKQHQIPPFTPGVRSVGMTILSFFVIQSEAIPKAPITIVGVIGVVAAKAALSE